ncbi:MAG: LysE family transporter [Atribacterota bacterium]|jgi:cysteine/O-acetylserine efflux protein|nr:LysE family transporter [Atribacterota bacterium]
MVDFASLIPFVLITIFTPGPANIACTSMAVNFGIKKTMGFIYGISLGFILIMLVASFFSNLLLTVIPSIKSIMKWIGAAYILYLAYNIFKTDYSLKQKNKELKPFALRHGFLLQLLNPKLFIFILTLYTTFLYPIVNNPKYIILSTSILALLGFSSNLLWASFGAIISHFLQNNMLKKIVNSLLALLLVYTAFRLTGIAF